jgi:NAD(P)-dependent dehydrogenase (short-subunit alcohol dehydrogenase family)
VRAAGAEAVVVQGDVSEDADCRKIAAAAEPYGRIDALANNAGITKHAPAHGDLDALSRADFERIFAVNVIGPFQMVRAARALLETSERTAPVLMVSSIAGVGGVGSSVAYAASKGALNTMTLSMARSLAPKIRVNAICPAYIETPWHAKGLTPDQIERFREANKRMAPLQTIASAEDAADVGLFFLSDASRHVTGETLLVDGGLHLGFAGFKLR